MLIAFSNSILRHTSPFPATFFLRRCCFSIAAAKHPQNHPNHVQNKKLFKSKQSFFKEFSSLAPVLSPQDNPTLSDSQAIGTVAAAQANFMRVIVHEEPSGNFEASPSPSHPHSLEASRITGVELLCVVKAVLKKIRRRVLVGDKVVVGSIDWVDRRGMIENVFQRSSEILDPPVANVDHLLVLFSLDQPKLEPLTLTRFLVEAESTDIPLTLALNKSELVDEESRLSSWGYNPLFCSVESRHGLDFLASVLKNQTTVIVGPSGVGKSSLINALRNSNNGSASADDNWFEPILGSKWLDDQRVGEVSSRSGRGKHTTRHVSLLPLSGGGYLADTPGFNHPSLMKVTKQTLGHTFPEIRNMLSASEPEKCAFKDCLHVGEPGCIIKGDWERYPYYFQLLDEIKIRGEFQLRTFGTKRESDVRYKVGDGGVQQAEPRLERKKHRRQSRKRTNQSILDDVDELEDDDQDEVDELDDKENLQDMEADPMTQAMRSGDQRSIISNHSL